MLRSVSSRSAGPSLLSEGETCWRSAIATRATLLIDGDEYFRALRSALLQARHQVLIAGWDFDTRTSLPGEAANDDAPTELGELLGYLIRRRPDLQVHVLRWDYHWLYADDRERDTQARLERVGVHFHADACHPITGCVHHKVVIIDDALAFCGGMDLTHQRWDTCRHDELDPGRCDHTSARYAPVHDVQLCLSGPIVEVLADYVRQQWPVRDRAPKRLTARHDLWPGNVCIDFRNILAGVSRTLPAAGERDAVREIETMYLAAIRGTRHSLYLENQYFTSERIAQAIVEQLRREKLLEGLLIGLDQPQTAVEYHTMGYGRARFHRILRDAGVEDRVPMVAAFSASTAINVHSKLAIFDDRALTVGSANLNRRSMGFDVECNILLEASSETHRATIRGLRDRLLAEHLGSEPEEIAALVRAHGIARLPERAQRTRRLVRVDPQQRGANFGPLLAPFFDRETDWPPLSVPLPTMDKEKLPRTALFAGLMTAAAFTSTVVAEELPTLTSLQKLVTQLLGE